MNKILNKLSLAELTTQSSDETCAPVVCNYANNYYGDQVCVPLTATNDLAEKNA